MYKRCHHYILRFYLKHFGVKSSGNVAVFDKIVEWGALGFIFAIAALPFDDTPPRGHSDIDFVEDDKLTVIDLNEGLVFGIGGLKLHGVYIRGRSLKTDVVVNVHGVVTITTYGRGESLLRWLDILKGKKHRKEV